MDQQQWLFSTTDLIAPAKVMAEYAKKYEKLELKVGVVEGKIIDVNGIKALAELPSKEVLIVESSGRLQCSYSRIS